MVKLAQPESRTDVGNLRPTSLVTGGASGLGLATAAALVSRGDAVVVLDLEESIGQSVAIPGVKYVAADVTSSEQVRSTLAVVADHASDLGSRLRTVVNCAGIAPTSRLLQRGQMHELDLIRRTIDVNLLGTLYVIACAAEVMQHNEPLDGERGVIINTSSIAAYDGQVGQIAYSASKSGIAGMTLPAARDLGRHGIRVCTIAPGMMATPMTDSMSTDLRESLKASVPFPSRFGLPEEFAALVLAIRDHRYINGEVIRMDGAARLAFTSSGIPR